MIYCFDLDGTMTREPVALKAMMIALRCMGQTVIVLTAVERGEANRPNRLTMLAKYDFKEGVHFDEMVCVETADDKAQFCLNYGVACMFEDDSRNTEAIRRLSPKTACWLIAL